MPALPRLPLPLRPHRDEESRGSFLLYRVQHSFLQNGVLKSSGKEPELIFCLDSGTLLYGLYFLHHFSFMIVQGLIISPSGKPNSLAFNKLLRIFPLRVLGKFSKNEISFGATAGPNFFLAKPVISIVVFSSETYPGFNTMNAFTNSPITVRAFR